MLTLPAREQIVAYTQQLTHDGLVRIPGLVQLEIAIRDGARILFWNSEEPVQDATAETEEFAAWLSRVHPEDLKKGFPRCYAAWTGGRPVSGAFAPGVAQNHSTPLAGRIAPSHFIFPATPSCAASRLPSAIEKG